MIRLFCLVLLLPLAACGVRGNLYLPQEAKPESSLGKGAVREEKPESDAIEPDFMQPDRI